MHWRRCLSLDNMQRQLALCTEVIGTLLVKVVLR